MGELNNEKTWRIVTEDGELVDTTRLKITARRIARKQRFKYLKKLNVEKIKNG